MTQVLMMVQFIFTIIMGMYFFNALKGQQSNKVIIDKESRKEMSNLKKLRDIKLSQPLTEKSRPSSFDEIIGQQMGIKALQAALCGPNPQHVIIYGPPGVGKTAAARLVLKYAKKKEYCPFRSDAKFIEIDATTIRFDDRGIADPLIGSVHDPIYQGAGALGVAGIPQPKPGAVTKAHGGILFIDEIGELHPTEMNKLLKVLEDRKVFLDSSYYNSSNPNVPTYIKDIFENGLPADFRLVGATTRSPEEISPALRSRCVEIFFRGLLPEEIESITENASNKIGFKLENKVCDTIGRYANNGRDAVNFVQLASGIALNEKRDLITIEDVEWIIENGHYSPRPEIKINTESRVGFVNGLAVYGANMGTVMPIEATAIKGGIGNINVTGIVEEEQIDSFNRKMKRKSTAKCSVENVITALKNVFGIEFNKYDIHVNFLCGIPVDGPSAGISITTAIYSAINDIPIDNKVAMTGEISLYGEVKPVGGVNSKIQAAIKAGAKIILIPYDNWQENFSKLSGVKVIAVNNIKQVIDIAMKENSIEKNNSVNVSGGILSAECVNVSTNPING